MFIFLAARHQLKGSGNPRFLDGSIKGKSRKIEKVLLLSASRFAGTPTKRFAAGPGGMV